MLKVFETRCSAPSATHLRPYTGSAPVDQIACILVEFFTVALSPPIDNYVVNLLGSLAVVFFTVLLDAGGRFGNGALAIGIPLIAGVAGQLKGAGLALPIYWLFSFFGQTTGNSLRRPSAIAVEAMLFASIVGIVVPTTLMLFRLTPELIAAWQPFPIYVALAQTLYLAVFSRTKNSSGPEGTTRKAPNARVYLLTQSAFFTLSAVATLHHIPFLFSIVASPNPLATLKHFLIPSLQPPSHNPDLHANALRFLQWDGIFIMLSTWLAGAWSWAFGDVKSFIAAVIGSVLGGAILGPGVAVAGVWMWKEWRDENARIKLA